MFFLVLVENVVISPKRDVNSSQISNFKSLTLLSIKYLQSCIFFYHNKISRYFIKVKVICNKFHLLLIRKLLLLSKTVVLLNCFMALIRATVGAKIRPKLFIVVAVRYSLHNVNLIK